MIQQVPIEINPVGTTPFWRLTARVGVPRGLSGSEFVPFQENLKFAGLSADGRLLSYQEPGDGTFAGCKIVPQAPANWVQVPTNEGIFLTDNQPEMVLVPDVSEYKIDRVYLSPAHLLPRYTLVKQLQDIKKPNASIGYGYDNLILKLYTKYPSTEIVQPTNWNIRLIIPNDLVMEAGEWEQINLLLINGKTTGTYKETLPINADRNYAWVPAKTAAEMETVWGLKGLPLVAQNKPTVKLGFKKLEITDPAKASKLHPLLALVKTVAFDTLPDRHVWAKTPEMLQMPQLFDGNPYITCCSDFSHTAFPKENQELLAKVLTPLYHHDYFALIASTKLEEYFIPVRKASKQFDLRGIKKVQVRSEVLSQNGSYIALKDLPPVESDFDPDTIANKLATKYPAIRKSTITNLCRKYKNSKSIEKHLQIKVALLNDELIPAAKCRILPMLGKAECINWLKEQKQLTICPLTDNKYLPNYKSVDALAVIPKFVQFLDETTLDSEFIKKLIISDAVRAAVISEKL